VYVGQKDFEAVLKHGILQELAAGEWGVCRTNQQPLAACTLDGGQCMGLMSAWVGYLRA
jgi:hypothetical protein